MIAIFPAFTFAKQKTHEPKTLFDILPAFTCARMSACVQGDIAELRLLSAKARTMSLFAIHLLPLRSVNVVIKDHVQY